MRSKLFNIRSSCCFDFAMRAVCARRARLRPCAPRPQLLTLDRCADAALRARGGVAAAADGARGVHAAGEVEDFRAHGGGDDATGGCLLTDQGSISSIVRALADAYPLRLCLVRTDEVREAVAA